jgi:iron complex transport system ATP-binding protein
LDCVSVRYPASRHPRAAVEGVTFAVRAGSLTALLGPNGSGKSTLLRVAAGLLEPTEGAVCVFGRNLRGMDRRQLARLIALLPQSEAVATGFRVREVVAMGRAPHQGAWLRAGAEDRRAVERALARCDLGLLADRRVDELSGGEQRRVALARALAQEARLLLLDEPSAFLDARHRLELYALLRDVVATDRVACVVAMHELDAAARIAHEVVLLREGRTIAAGTPDDVMTPLRLREAFDVDVAVHLREPAGRKVFVLGGD